MIIAIANQNGSARKHPLADKLGLLRARSGRKVLLIDTDPKAPLCAWSGARRAADSTPRVLARGCAGNGLQTELETLLPHYNDIVINTEQRDTPEGRTALIAARLVIVPVLASQIDLARQYQLIARLNSARMFNPGLHVLFVIISDQSDPSPDELAAIRAYVSRVMSATLASTVIHEPLPPGASLHIGDSGAAREALEMRALYGEVYAK